MEISHKSILIISPQPWGNMYVAKHHYAIELAKQGNQVFFLNPPNPALDQEFELNAQSGIKNLHVLSYRPFFPLGLRFHIRWLYDFLMAFQIHRLNNFLNRSIDLVWCFEPNLYSNLHLFKGKTNIYHPVDELFYDYQIKVGQSAHLILSVTQEILDKFHKFKVPKYFIHHGLAEEFINTNPIIRTYPKEGTIKVGYTGNLLRKDIDIPVFIEIIQSNPEIEFHIWGSYQSNSAEQTKEAIQSKDFIKFLQQAKNVTLYGAVSPSTLAKDIQGMDAFLICYDVNKDQSKGTNYHKVMEYLSTGKVIISNNITTYVQMPHLVQMIPSRKNNAELIILFNRIINQINSYNNAESQLKRIAFAKEHTYGNHINAIKNILIFLN